KRFEEIKTRHDRGEPVSREDRDFAMRYMAQHRKGGGADNAAWAKAHPARESTGLVPLPDLGAGMYQGEQGGFYPGGKNMPPPAHLEAGVALATKIVPLDTEGRPSASGKIVLLSAGMSNTTMEFSAFQKLAASSGGLNPQLVIVDGAQGGQTAKVTANPEANYWKVCEQRLSAAGVTGKQVQAVWIKQANARPTEGFPAAARMLEEDLIGTLHNLHDKYPNLKIAYLSSRIYGGYATSPLNPEPYAYEGAFADKWVIADQIAGKPGLNYDPAKGAVRAPWVAWGPYLWADGAKGRKQDGLVWAKDDFVPTDRTHPADSARQKVAKLLLDFLKSEPTARPWFVGSHR
ncbi:MAG: hypothetical protein M1541_03695, partial [Acidobacteria bacterium]|nr:hypothetical protein [Acidobacteriota bacterium]